MLEQTLQTISQVAVFIGVLLTGLGGFGAFYFGKVVDRQKEEAAEKNESALRKDVGKLLEGNQSLQQRLEPFEKLAQQLHPTMGRDEALQTLRGDLKQLQDRASAIEKKAAPRKLSESQIQQIVSMLHQAPAGGASVTSVMGDQEAFQFAVQLKAALEKAGWSVNGVNQAYTNPITGIIVTVHNEPAPAAANQLFGALHAIGYPPAGNLNPSQPENSVWLVIGSKQ